MGELERWNNLTGGPAECHDTAIIPSGDTVTVDFTASVIKLSIDACGTNTLPSNYSNYTLNPTSTIEYYGTDQPLFTDNIGTTNISYGNLRFTERRMVQVTRTAVATDFASQHTITNKTLNNLTVDYAGPGQVLTDLTNFSKEL